MQATVWWQPRLCGNGKTPAVGGKVAAISRNAEGAFDCGCVLVGQLPGYAMVRAHTRLPLRSRSRWSAIPAPD